MFRLFAAFSLCLYATCAVAANITVAVATNFKPSLQILATSFEANSGHTLRIISASTGMLYSQILNGAPYDVFLAADELRPTLLEQQGLTEKNTRFTYANGQLALLYPGDTSLPMPGQDHLKQQLQSTLKKIAIANPRLAPYGVASQQVLLYLNIWDDLKGQLVRCANIAQCYQFVATGNAGYGFVSLAYLKTGKSKLAHWIIPKQWYQPIRQQATLLQSASNKPAAREFLHFLQSLEAREIIRSHGYLLPATNVSRNLTRDSNY